MSEILEMIPKHLSNEWSVERYSDTYRGYCKALKSGEYLFNMLQEVFLNICKEINVQKGLFRLQGKSADELFSQTLEWIFPMPFENPFEEDEEDHREYNLIWDGKDRNYKYIIEVGVPAYIFEHECPEDIACSGKIFRQDAKGNNEFWHSEKQAWIDIHNRFVKERFSENQKVRRRR